MKYKRKNRSQGEVELNMAAMLVMAFQLLAFFILTFSPSPVEAPIALRMPPAAPLQFKASSPAIAPSAAPTITEEPEKGEKLIVEIKPAANGEIDRIVIGSRAVSGAAGKPEEVMGQFGLLLKEVLGGAQFESVHLHAGPQLRYDRLLEVVDVCTRQKLADGTQLTKVSFTEVLD